MSSSKSIAAARARRSGEQQQQQNQRPNTSIASTKNFAQPPHQTGPSQQKTLNLANPGGKISVSDAIGLTTIRLGKVEQFIQHLQEEGGYNSNFAIPDNAQLIDKSVITNIISRIDSLEKKDISVFNEKISKLENEIKNIKELITTTKSSLDNYIVSNEKRFDDIDAAFVELENNQPHLENSTQLNENNVELNFEETDSSNQ
jgi:hypothetical protein